MSFEEINYCETFYPTEQEFQDFKGYVTRCESLAKSGIIKVTYLLQRLFLLQLGNLERIITLGLNLLFLIQLNKL